MSTLEAYLVASIPPRGLSLCLQPATSELSECNAKKWRETLKNASLQLVGIVLNHYRSSLKSLINREQQLLNQYSLSPEESSSLNTYEQKKRCVLDTHKSKKLLRDGVIRPISTPLPPIREITRTPVPDNIVNISSATLSKEQVSLLSRGLSFCPASGSYNEFQLYKDLDNFARNMRLHEYFFDQVTPADDPTALPSLKRWTPASQRDKHLDIFIKAVTRDIIEAYNKRRSFRKNLSNLELKAMADLCERIDITIKPADKGGAVVVMDTIKYIAEADNQLNNSSFYKRLDADPTAQYKETLGSTIKALIKDKKISDKATSLIPLDPVAGRFYLLPKIHKQNNPGRPIVSGIGTVTESLSRYVDSLISQIPPTFQSFLRDTTHFLSDINNLTVPINALLVTLDVASLYTNIPHLDGIRAVTEAYDHSTLDKPIDSSTLAILLQMILQYNNFEFNGVHYVQVSGTSMGTKIGPNYANIFMGILENNFLSSRSLKPFYYKRFIDDIFIIWPHGEATLLSFISAFNNVHPSISFSHSYSPSTIDFLDVTVCIHGTQLTTKLYRKPTDRHRYLHFESSHKRDCKLSIPYSQALRFKRICSEQSDFNANCTELRSALLKQKYPAMLIDDAVRRADALERTALCKTKKNLNSHSEVNLVLTHNASAPNVTSILRKHHNILQQSERLTRAFPQPPRVVYRRGKNLRDLLTSSKTKCDDNTQLVGCHPCKKPRCKVCAHMTTTTCVTSTATDFKINIRGNFDCDTQNAIYLLECSICHLQYLGQTETAFRYRFNNHRAHVHALPHLPISRHVTDTGHSFSNIQATIIESGFKTHHDREIRESFLIHKFQTLSNGMNESPGTLTSMLP